MTTRPVRAFALAGSRHCAAAFACCVTLLLPATARAQLITVKTAPVAESPQFAALPAANVGLGGVSIALADTAFDPFVNPAKGARLTGVRLVGSPAFHSVSRQAGGAVTLPVGLFASSGPWFSAFALALQDVERGPDDGQFFPPPVARTDGPPGIGATSVVPTSRDDPSRQNGYVHAALGRRLPARGTSVAASVSWWGLHAVDGVEVYYPRGESVRQHGDMVDIRLGVLKEWRNGATLEALGLHHRLGVSQDVTRTEAFWDPTLRTIVGVERVVPNADRTGTWGMHLAYTRPLADSTWRVGGILTGNHIDQPRMPDYALPQVPADAGRARAYDVGAGISRADGRWTAGLDAIYEPISNRTWVRARTPTETRAGAPIDAGEKTLESRFRFDNAILRAGVGRTFDLGDERSLTLQAGAQLKAYRYRLDQWDALQQAARASSEGWNEWTRGWGASLHLADIDLQYRGRLTTGAGRPGVDDFGNVVFVTDAIPIGPGGWGFAPQPLPFGGVRVTAHQFVLSFPIR